MHPKLIEIGSFTIHTYGALLASAFLIALWLTARLARRDGIPKQQAWDLGFVLIVSAMLGAKLLMVLVDLDYYASRPSRLVSIEFLQAGGVFYGGLIGAVLGAAIYVRRHPGLNFWKIADAAAPAIALGQSVGRLGCFAAGCDYGKVTSVPWAVKFTSEYAGRFVGVPLNASLHPTQLYEATATAAICGFLVWLHSHRRFPGQIFASYLLLYGVARFTLEFFRGDTDRGLWFSGSISTSQLISLIAIPLALYWYQQRGQKIA